MCATFPDGSKHEIPNFTVKDFNEVHKSKQRTKHGSQKYWEGATKDGWALSLRRRRDGPNPDKCSLFGKGPESSGNAAQLCSIMYRDFDDEKICVAFMTSLAKDVCGGKVRLEDIKDERDKRFKKLSK